MQPAVFLDRDGTINIEKNYLYRIEDFRYIEGVITALKKLYEAGFLLVIITNQSGIARGYYTEEDYLKLNEWLISDLKKKGIVIARSYYCPHYPQARVKKYRVVCDCRKPGAELFKRAISELNIDVGKSYAVGDKMRDLAICAEQPVQGILLQEGNKDDEPKIGTDYLVCKNLAEAADKILEGIRLIP